MEGNWSLVYGKHHNPSRSPELTKDVEANIAVSPSRFSPLEELEQEDEELDKKFEADENKEEEEMDEGELVEKRGGPSKVTTAKGRRHNAASVNKSTKKTIARAKPVSSSW